MGVWPGSNLVVKMLRLTKYYSDQRAVWRVHGMEQVCFSKTGVSRAGLSVNNFADTEHVVQYLVMHSDQIRYHNNF